MGEVMHPSPYGNDETVELFFNSLDCDPRTAISIWQRTLRIGIFVNAVQPGELTSAMERLEHGDSLDSIEATLRRMWQGLEDRLHEDSNAFRNDILTHCGQYFLSAKPPDSKWVRFLTRVLGGEEMLNVAISLARAKT
jgi:hypothetical protein